MVKVKLITTHISNLENEISPWLQTDVLKQSDVIIRISNFNDQSEELVVAVWYEQQPEQKENNLENK